MLDMREWTALLYFTACVLASGVWVAVGIYKLLHYHIMVERIREKHIPLPVLAYWCSVMAELGGALLVVTQWSVCAGALIWIVFLLIATPIYHGGIWRDGAVDYPQFVHFFKNVSIFGGLLALIALNFSHIAAVPPHAVPAVVQTVK